MIGAPCQMTLGLRERRSARDGAREDARTLVAALEARPELRGAAAAEVCAAFGWTDRRLRAAAEASDGEVLSAPGCTGYRLARLSTVDEYYNLERAHYTSQIQMMQARVCAMDKAVHRAKRRTA
jgi:hypothetical protein